MLALSSSFWTNSKTCSLVVIDHSLLSPANAVIFQWKLVILPQRVPDPVFRQEDTAKIGMPREPDPGEIVDFALMPVGRAPQGSNRWHLRQFTRLVVFPARQDQLEREPVPVGETLQMINHLDVRVVTCLWSLFGIRLQIIDPADAIQDLEAQSRVVAQESADREQIPRLDHHIRVNRVGLFSLNAIPELLVQNGNDFGRGHQWLVLLSRPTLSPASPVPWS